MCDHPGNSFTRLDRELGKLRGFVSCACGEREVPISAQPNGERTMGIDYRPDPDLRRADVIAQPQP